MLGCDFRTKLKRSVDKHMFVHTGIKQFTCDWPGCGREFAMKQGLKNHHALHVSAGELKFECDVCGLKYAEQSSLRNHQKMKHLKTPKYLCTWPGCDHKG